MAEAAQDQARPADAEQQPAQGAKAPAKARPESDFPFLVHIGRVYDGPFDLLLDLIRKQDLDIYDIPISRITAQYLAYLETLRDLDVEGAADFLLMAATLIQIKSKMLLPADPVIPGETPIDPREELVQRLIEYEQFKSAAAMLHERQQLEEASWCRPGIHDFVGDEGTEAELAVDMYDLVRTFRQILQRAEERPRLEIEREDVTVGDMILHLRRLLTHTADPIPIRAIFATAPSRRAVLATFLAVLELVRMHAAVLRQERIFGDIVIKRHAQFANAFPGSGPVEVAEPDYR